MAWTTITLQVTTPLFNGGAGVGEAATGTADDTAVRVASIRGALRFWFRALAGTVAGPDLRLLAGFERQAFGDAGTASPVQLRIPRQPPLKNDRRPAFLDGADGKWIAYLLGQGLTEWNRDEGRFLLTRSYIEPGRKFELKLRFPEDDIGTLALGALRLLTMYGGLGARVRRGFGGIRILGTEGPIAEPWTEDALKGNGLRDHAGKRALEFTGELARCRDILVAMRPRVLQELGRPETSAPKASDGPPSYPVLSPDWSVAGLGAHRCGNWEEVLRYAGKQLRYFRANEKNTSPTARYQPRIETAEWKEVVWGDSDHFEVGALGLPVGFKDGYVANVDRGHGDDADKLRRASPLWLRTAEYNGNWALLSFAFLGQFLPGPDAPGIHLWHNGQQGKALQVTPDDVKRLATQWINDLRGGRSYADTARRAYSA